MAYNNYNNFNILTPLTSEPLLADSLKSNSASRFRLHDTTKLISSPSTTASHTTWLPPPAVPRQGPTPQPEFSNDFDLFSTQTQARHHSHQRAAPLVTKQRPTFSYGQARALAASKTHYNTLGLQYQRRIPPVPLFHSGSTTSLQDQTPDQFSQTDFTMAGGNAVFVSLYDGNSLIFNPDINVAYEGTSADLGVSDAALFGDLGWEELYSSIESLPAAAGFTSVNNGTVSPKDLFNDSVSSLPPSTAFTDLTTPGSALIDTPDDAYEASPLFHDTLTSDVSANDTWFSLFPDSIDNTHNDSSPPAPTMTRTVSSSSHVLVHPGGESRKRSSTHVSPMTVAARPSSTAGIHKRDKTLPPIIVSEDDPVALKRARNTAAARKSRDKKFREREGLEGRISELEDEVAHWKALALAKDPSLDS